MNKDFKMTATTLKGLEGVLAEELKKLGAQDIKEGIRSVTYRGDNGFLYKSNIALRTAIRILKPIRTCKIYDEEDLYEALQKIKWEKYLDVEGTFAIAAVVNSKNFTSNSPITSKYPGLILFNQVRSSLFVFTENKDSPVHHEIKSIKCIALHAKPHKPPVFLTLKGPCS